MIKNLLLALPATLVALIFYVSFTDQVMQNVQHLFFLSASTVVVYCYQISQNPYFNFIKKIKWYLLLLIVPSIFAVIYWYKYINIQEEE